MPTNLRDTINGSFQEGEHREFVRNRQRNKATERAIDRHCHPGRPVIEVGTGTGIFAIMMAERGSLVTVFEKHKKLAAIARRNFLRRNVLDRIKIIEEDVMEWDKLPYADVVLGELLSTWSVVEQQVPVVKHMLSVMPNKPVLIPQRLHHYAQGVNAQFGDDEGLVEIPGSHFFEFAADRKARPATRSKKVLETNFSPEMLLDEVVEFELHGTRQTCMNTLRLETWAETDDNVFIEPSDDTNPRMLIPLGKTIYLEKGQKVPVHIEFPYGKGWEEFKVQV